MPGLSPKLPLHIDQIDGYGLTKTFKEVARQNLKMVILTSPGERIMIPEFGVGIRNYLFELSTPELRQNIKARINDQVDRFMPFLDSVQIFFRDVEEKEHSLSMRIEYFIGPIGKVDFIDLVLSSNIQKIS